LILPPPFPIVLWRVKDVYDGLRKVEWRREDESPEPAYEDVVVALRSDDIVRVKIELRLEVRRRYNSFI